MRIRIDLGSASKTTSIATLRGLSGSLRSANPILQPGIGDGSSGGTVSDAVEFAQRAVVIGVGATLVMDAWAFVLRRLGIPSLNFALLGRWIGHLPRGQWSHAAIAKATPIRGELVIGWCAHYSIGILFSAALLSTFGLQWARSPSLFPALLVGIVTVLAPLLVLQPALGAGIASSKTASPFFNSMKSLVTHTVFGFGLYLAALATASVIPAGT